MLARARPGRRPGSGRPHRPVDVVLCDPIGRAVQIEEYLGLVAALTLAPVLVFTWSKSPSSVRRSLAAGARGYLSKAVSAADLVAAVTPSTVARP